MGIFRSLARLVWGAPESGSTPHGPHFAVRHQQTIAARRGFAIEPLEERKLLAADLHIGAVYYEEASGEDLGADVIEITFDGGAEGTQLTRLEFDTDKVGDGLTIGDVLFDTADGGLGAFGSSPLELISHDGIDSVSVTVADGGTTLVFEFTGFDAGETLLFQVDVDEQGFLGPNAVAEGNEFEGTKLTAHFTAPHYYDTTGTDIFIDAYDAKLAASGLTLPPDDYVPPGNTPNPVRTAGAIFPLTQTPLPVSIAGTVYEDVNLNNVQETGDPGIAGVTLELFVRDGSTYVTTGQTTTTNGVGDYRFDELLPGEYRVVESQPSGYFSVGATSGTVNGAPIGTVVTTDIISDVTLLGGQDSIDNDFAESLPAELSGYVYHDVNNDGVMTSDEPGIAGVEVRIERVGGEPAAPVVVFTDSSGFWAATGLLPSEYRVTEIQPTAFLDGLDIAGSAGGSAHNPGDMITGITLVSGQSGINYKFGELLASSISGRVHADTDGDCVLDDNEVTLAGVTIYLLDASGARIDETTTNDKGEYEFNGLAPGVYGVEEVQPAGYYDGDEHVGSAGGTLLGPDSIIDVTLTSGTQAVRYDFCEHPPVSISGFVYEDDNNDGVRDAGEAPIAGVTLTLLDAAGNPTSSTTTTDTTGHYSFDGLAPGTYGVREAQPTGYFDGLDTAGTAGGVADNPGDEITAAMLTPGLNGEQYNFGELRAASVSGRVHADRDDDCVLDEGETPLGGVEIRLLDANGEIVSTTHTADDGTYQFTNLRPGTYSVFEVQPTGYFNGDQVVGSVGGAIGAIDHTVGITLDPGVAAVGYNFCEIEPASLSGHVYVDGDNDGVRDTGEPGIGGVKITLLDADGQPTDRMTTTDASGFYRFDNLEPGKYGVAETHPDGFIDGLDAAGSAGGVATNPGDLITGAMLSPAENAVDYDFGELRPASISGRVHVDDDGDCVVDPGELRLEGVVIQLLGPEGGVIATTQTDANGEYRFEGLSPGVYGVREIQPNKYFQGGEHVGSAGGLVITDNEILFITLNSGQAAVEYDFCELRGATISGYVFQDGPVIEIQPGETIDPTALRDGLFTPDDTPIRGTVLELGNFSGEPIRDAAGNPITTVTDSSGYYEFTDLKPGIYSVREIQPDGFIDSLDTAGTSAGSLAINPNVAVPSTLSVSPRHDMIVSIDVGAGDVSLSNNFSEVTTTTSRPPQEIPPTDPLPPIVRPLLAAPARPVLPLTFVPRPDPQLELLAGGPMGGYTWHLSIIDAGAPRGLMPVSQEILRASSGQDVFSMYSGNTNHGRWLLGSADGETLYDIVFGLKGAVPLTGDFNGDGISELALYYDGLWLIDINGNGEWDADDLWAELGDKQDQPITGDWDGDGKTDIGIYGPSWAGDGEALLDEPGLPDLDNPTKPVPKNVPPEAFRAATDRLRAMQMTAQGTIREDAIDHVFNYGRPDDKAVTGDFNGDGIDTIAVFRHGQWRLDQNGDGRFDDLDPVVHFGEVGDRPVVIDHDGNGVDELAVYRDGQFIIDANGNRTMDDGDLTIEMGQAGDVPVSGDFDGDGAEEPGVYRSEDGTMANAG